LNKVNKQPEIRNKVKAGIERMRTMNHKKVDLAEIFGGVTQSLIEDQQNLNRADEVNHSHGDHMVQTFQTITRALEQKKDRPDSEALAYASRQVAKTATSDSARLYAQNLQQASVQFKGKQVDEKGALELLQTLIGGEQPAQSSSRVQGSDDLLGSLLGGLGGGTAPSQQPQQTGSDDLLGSLLGGLAGGDSAPKPSQQTQQADTSDLLGSLLGGMGGGEASQQSSAGSDLLGSLLGGMGGGATPSQQSSQSGSSDMLGALLGGLGGGTSSQSSSGQQGGFNWQKLLAAGMAYLQAKQQGNGTPQALVQAFMTYSGMGRSPHRTESTEVVVSSYLNQLNTTR
jgi:hypothetical protein